MKNKLVNHFRDHATALNSPHFYVILALSLLLLAIALVQDIGDIIASFSSFWY